MKIKVIQAYLKLGSNIKLLFAENIKSDTQWSCV